MARFVKLDGAAYSRPGYNNHCTVTALAVACNMDFDAALAWAARCGRKKRRGFHVASLFPYYGPRWKMRRRKVNGAQLVDIDHCWARKLTLGRFLDRNRKGRFIVSTGNHAMAVIDGAVHDHRERRDSTRLCAVYTLKVPRRRVRAAPQPPQWRPMVQSELALLGGG